MKKFLTILFFILVPFAQYYFLKNLNISGDLITNIITFLSIIFGFYITSLAIFVTSQYVANLYNITDPKDSSVTLLHKLVKNYKFGLIAILTTILYLIIIFVLIDATENKFLSLNDWRLSLFTFFILFNFYYSYRMLSDLISIIVQEAKSKAEQK